MLKLRGGDHLKKSKAKCVHEIKINILQLIESCLEIDLEKEKRSEMLDNIQNAFEKNKKQIKKEEKIEHFTKKSIFQENSLKI